MEITQAAVKKLLRELTGQAQMLTIPRPFIELTGDHVCALFLSQIIYWSERTSDPEGWFYKTHEEWAEELCLTAYQVRRATEKLASLGVQSKVRKLKGQGPKLHYRLNDDVFTRAFLKYLNNKETSLLSDSKVKKLNNQETSLSEGEETSLFDNEETQLTIVKGAEITSAKTTREHTHTARSAPSPAEAQPAETGVCVSGSKLTLQQCRAWAEHQKANGARIDPYAVSLRRFEDGKADEDIAAWLKAGTPTQKITPRDTSGCPDCEGKGFYYPDGPAKGVAKCSHPHLAAAPQGTQSVPARASPS